MRRKVLVLFTLICLWLTIGVTTESRGDSAEVLPKGVLAVNARFGYYFDIDKRFDEDGKEENPGVDFSGTLDSNVFAGLAFLEQPVGPLPPGTANIGETDVDFTYEIREFQGNIQYGLTNRVTVGIRIPYWWLKNDVDAKLDTTNATVGINPAVPPVGLAPLFVPGTRPFTENDVQDLLGNGLDTNGDGTVDIAGFGYKRFKTWEDNGLGDIELGFRYQYLKLEDWRLAFVSGVRMPTGQTDDPDKLTDLGFGSGTWALLFRSNNDYTGIKNLTMNFTFKYDLLLPDKETRRVPDDVNQPITANREKVRRNLGDVFTLEGSASYQFLDAFNISALYYYYFKLKDKVSGDEGFRYETLEEESDASAHSFIGSLSYSTIPLFRQKKFPLPLVASIAYENVFAGENNTLKQQIIYFSLTSFF